MSKQKTVTLINIKKSAVNGNKHETTIFETLWLKKEVSLREQGWVLKSQIESIKVETVNDGLGINEVIVEEPKTVVEDITSKLIEKSYSEMSKEELQLSCTDKGIKFHHANKKEKLIELLEALN